MSVIPPFLQGLSIVGIQQLLGYCRPFTLTTPKFHGEGEPDSLQQTPIKDWKLGKLNHVAIAVPDLNKATTLYRDTLGAEVSDVMVNQIDHISCT